MPSPGCAACSALAIWDARSRQLLLARDRIGIKPLHYAVVNGRLYFGSEIKSILEAPDVSRDLDLDALEPLPVVPLHAARRVDLPGHPQAAAGPSPDLDATAGCTSSRYWRQPTRETFRGSEAEAVSELHGVLRRCRALASRQRCAARRVSVRRRRLEPGRRADGGGVGRTRQDVFDRVRRTRVRRARARAAGGARTSAPIITSSS